MKTRDQTSDDIYSLSDEERALVREGLAELDRGETVSETDVRRVFDKYRGDSLS